MSQKTDIVIVDDHQLFREGIKIMLSKDSSLSVVGEAATSSEAIAQISKYTPAVATIDISLEGPFSGIYLIEALSKRFTNLKMISITGHDSPMFAEKAIRAGAHAHITKREIGTNISAIIQTVLAGEIYISNGLASTFIKSILKRNEPGNEPEKFLSNRELEYFTLLGSGLTKSEISQKMNSSANAVESYRRRIKEKLSISSGAQLTQCAVQWAVNHQIDLS